jgi:hypothetical protein
MAAVEVKDFGHPDEVRPFEGKGRSEIVLMMGRPVGRGTFEPGWRWSANVRPIAGTDQCEVSHLGYCESGRMRITMTDGTRADVGPGDVVAIPPGHDAEVLGDENCVFIDFGEIDKYAKR